MCLNTLIKLHSNDINVLLLIHSIYRIINKYIYFLFIVNFSSPFLLLIFTTKATITIPSFIQSYFHTLAPTIRNFQPITPNIPQQNTHTHPIMHTPKLNRHSFKKKKEKNRALYTLTPNNSIQSLSSAHACRLGRSILSRQLRSRSRVFFFSLCAHTTFCSARVIFIGELRTHIARGAPVRCWRSDVTLRALVYVPVSFSLRLESWVEEKEGLGFRRESNFIVRWR